MPRHSRRARISIDRTNSPEWHDAMAARPDPNGVFAQRGFRTWDAVHKEMVRGMMAWEALPERVRVGYAFRNPEDR